MTNSNELRKKIARFLLDKRRCEQDFAHFVKSAWPIIEPGTALEWNWHLDTICGYLESYARRDIKRLIINVSPGCMKSILVSVMLPAWTWTWEAPRRYLCIANGDDLAVRDALKQKLIINSEWYQARWPISMMPDQREKTLFVNEHSGHRQSIGINSNITGKRGDDLLLDDPHDSKRAFSEVDRANIIRAYDQNISTRLNHMDKSGICLIMQRLHEEDLTGHLLKKKSTDWVHLCIPMEYDGKRFDAGKDIGRPELNDPRTTQGELLFENLFPGKVVESLKEDLGEYGAAGQLQQRPVPLGGGILKKKWFRIWDKPYPNIEHLFLSWDTAYTEKDMKQNAFSAFVGFGVFWHEQEQAWRLLMTRAWWDQVGYPDLRKKAIQITHDTNPDVHLIEKKASGISLVQDLRRGGVRVRTYMPDRDKIARAHSVSAAIQGGVLFIPEKQWAHNVIDYISTFPNGSPPSADLTDCVTQAIIYLLNGYWVQHPDDEVEEQERQNEERHAAYG